MIKKLRAQIWPALIITRREIRDQFRDWRILFPVVVLTIFFPGLMNFTARQAVQFVTRYGAEIVVERLFPFLLMIVGFFPISVSLVIALESFVGEKERHSIEPLLSSPLTDVQLYLGKLLAALVPPLLASYLGIGVYLFGLYREVGWKAPPQLLFQVVLLTTVQALVMVSGAVVVSAQTTSVRAANLLASFIIIPMALLIQAESMVMFWARYPILWLIIAGLALISVLLVRTGISHFSREELLGRELDTLNLRWAFSLIWNGVGSGAHSLTEWYRSVFISLKRLKLPVFLMLIMLAAGVYAGSTQAAVFQLPEGLLTRDKFDQGLIQGLDSLGFLSPQGVGIIWLHNLRAIFLAALAGLFSFGVLGVLVLMLPFMLIGYVMGNLASLGLPGGLFLSAFILPHGILEIPAIMLAGAGIIQIGASFLAPASGRSIGESVLKSVAEWLRIMLAVVLPLLLGAAILEVYLTPQVVVGLLGR